MDILDCLSIPERAIVNKKLPKKMFYENAELNKAEIDVFINEIEDISLVGLLNKDSTGIERYVTEDCSYTDIAVLKVNLKTTLKYQRVAKIIHDNLPHPVLEILCCKEAVILSTAVKRLNANDKTKVVIDEYVYSHWIDTSNIIENDKKFLNRIKITRLPFDNLYKLYIELNNRIFLTQVMNEISRYPSKVNDIKRIRELYSELVMLKNDISAIQAKMGKEKSFGRKMELHVKIKVLENKLILLKNDLDKVC